MNEKNSLLASEEKEKEERKKKIGNVVVGIITGIMAIAVFIITLFEFNIIGSTNSSCNKAKKYENYSIGETFTFDELEITVTDFEIESYYLLHTFEPDDGCKWAIVHLSMYNPTDSTKNLGDFFNKKYMEELIANEKTEYTSSAYSGSYYSGEFLLFQSSIRAKDKITGIYAYQVPDEVVDTAKLEFRFTFNKISDQDVIINVLLRDAVDTSTLE